MAKQTFGGDDEEGAPPEEKKQKLKLERFSGGPDVNVRELFWKIVSAYASGKYKDIDFAALEQDRFAILRAAIGALERPSPLYGRITSQRIARYALIMMLDAAWQDCFEEFLEDCSKRQKENVIMGLEKLCQEEIYLKKITDAFRSMLRYREHGETALRYLAQLRIQKLIIELKKELIILARGDIGENQKNAINALSTIIEDEDVIKTMIILLSHWDEEARMAAAERLLSKGVANEEVRSAAKKRMESESDPIIKKMLEKIAK